MRPGPSIALALFLAISPGKAADSGMIELYAAQYTTAAEAEKNCPGLAMNRAYFAVFLDKFHFTPADDDAIGAEFGKTKPAIQKKIIGDGAVKWCGEVVRLFGPRGTVAPLLRQK